MRGCRRSVRWSKIRQGVGQELARRQEGGRQEDSRPVGGRVSQPRGGP